MPRAATCPATSTLALERLRKPQHRWYADATRRHTCHEVQHACFWQRSVLIDAPLEPAMARTKVRGVHVGFMETRMDALGLFRPRNHSSDPPPPSPPLSSCVPLVFWPLWGYNIGEFFQNSILPIAELLAAGAIDREGLLLLPEVGGWPLRDFHTAMLRAFTAQPVRTVGQLAPKCGRRRGECARPACFARAVFCRFRDVYDGRPWPVAPWSAAQTVARHLRKPGAPLPVPRASLGATAAYVVLFASRRAAKNGARLISNEAGLLEECNRWAPPPACVEAPSARAGRPSAASLGLPPTVASRCALRTFGAKGFRADVAAVRAADVLVGTHGAALVHAIFMGRGGALVEIRPYGFVGRWPDQYHYTLHRQQNETHAFVLRTVDRTLCTPVPAANVSAWDARPLNTHVRPAAFRAALAAAACTSGRAGTGGLEGGGIPLEPPAASPIKYSTLHSVTIDNG